MYAPVSAMRSTRYPLMGLGCGCSPAPAPVSGLGCGCGPVGGLGQFMTAATSLAAGFSIAGAGATGLILGYFLGKHAQRTGLALNRGRHRRGRR